MSLYTDLIKAGCKVANWQSDLYVERTELALTIVENILPFSLKLMSLVYGYQYHSSMILFGVTNNE